MPQIMPWWCPHTNLMFPTKEQYLAHVKAMAADRYDLRTRQGRFEKARAFIDANLYRVGSIEALQDFIIENAFTFYVNGVGQEHRYLDQDPHWRSKLAKTWTFTEVSFRVREYPHGYLRIGEARNEPCLAGDLIFRYEFDDPDVERATNPFRGTRIVTGSGSGTGHSGSTKGVMGYEVALLRKDWPNLFVGEKLLA